jgi:hypothetical protein
LEGRAGALRVVVGVDVRLAPPIFVIGSSVVLVVDDLDMVLFPDLMLPDGDGCTEVVANVLP